LGFPSSLEFEFAVSDSFPVFFPKTPETSTSNSKDKGSFKVQASIRLCRLHRPAAFAVFCGYLGWDCEKAVEQSEADRERWGHLDLLATFGYYWI
jgi:hypothetical protein